MRRELLLFAVAAILAGGCTTGKKDFISYDNDVVIMTYDRSVYPVEKEDGTYEDGAWENFEYVQECHIVSTKTGQEMSDLTFRSLTPFADGVSVATGENGSMTYVGKDGKRIIDEEFKKATVFSEGLAWVQNDMDEVWAIDRSGKKLFKVDEVGDISVYYDGKAVCHTADGATKVYDKTGKVVFENAAYGGDYVVDGCIAMQGEGGNAGLMDMNKNYIIKPLYYSICGIEYNPCEYVRQMKADRLVVIGEGGYGIVDRSGKSIVRPEYAYIAPDGDLFLVSYYKSLTDTTFESKSFWLDKSGDVAVGKKYLGASRFAGSSYAPVSDKEGEWGLVGKDGKWFMEPVSDWIAMESVDANGLIVVTDSSYKSGLMNIQKVMIVPAVYDGLVNIKGTDKYIIGSDGKYGIINSRGTVILEPEYGGFVMPEIQDNEILATTLFVGYDECDHYENDYEDDSADEAVG